MLTISRIDLYCGFYDLKEISVFGESSGQVIKRLTFLERYQHAFHHVCAWKYAKDYGIDCKFKLDHFEGHKTPAWKELSSQNNLDLEVYFNGCECDPIITVADIVLKLIDLHQYGFITSRTMLDVICKRCPSFGNANRKLAYHSMKEYLRVTAPDSTLRIDLTNYLKHPIYFLMWVSPSAQEPKDRVKSMLEWSPIYNNIVRKAYQENGCLKQFKVDADHMIWDTQKDKLIAWSTLEEQMIEQMKNMGFEIPKVLTKNDLKP